MLRRMLITGRPPPAGKAPRAASAVGRLQHRMTISAVRASATRFWRCWCVWWVG